jgi:hypothetical protein
VCIGWKFHSVQQPRAPLLTEPAECIDIAIVRVEEPIVGPGDRTSVRVHVLNSGTTTAEHVTIALADAAERGSAGVVMRQLGDMPPASIKSTTLWLSYAITNPARLGALTVSVFTRSHPPDEDTEVRRSAAWPEQPRPIATRSVREEKR